MLPDEYELMYKYAFGRIKEINKNDIKNSLDILISILYEHYDRRVIILIDEYDRIINNLYGNNSLLYDEAINLLTVNVMKI
ncbi:hypothetical protein SteCoe_38340 [Stentor coeruleus]|uniref:AAA-ATPase-like domain-containing protein n=1 Tax=Stentor coeruleus TaxID=5963 RepID=A0A1R2ALK6_9CILI|nr:hypothetical protein SteCoe_38340 [Stentor coeruleus]